jgi:hypothetical protein
VRQTKGRDALDLEKLSGFDAAMSGDDPAIITDQHRIGESEPSDAVRDLPNLLLGMRPRVAIIRAQSRYGNILESGVRHLQNSTVAIRECGAKTNRLPCLLHSGAKSQRLNCWQTRQLVAPARLRPAAILPSIRRNDDIGMQ